jgi:DNA invertase Pin-like site-specific DNA recombinase
MICRGWRDNYLMLTVLAELQFAGVNVVSVADGLEGQDAETTLGIQIRGICNELQLQDLKKKTLRGQIGQKQRGFSAGEHPYGYTSVPVGANEMSPTAALTRVFGARPTLLCKIVEKIDAASRRSHKQPSPASR